MSRQIYEGDPVERRRQSLRLSRLNERFKECEEKLRAEEEEWLPLVETDNYVAGPSPEDSYILSQTREAISKTIPELPGRLQEFINLRFGQGLTLQEIAERFGLTTRGGAWVIENNAINQLKLRL